MEKELLELYEAAKMEADAASSGDGEPEESRCIDALEQLKKFPFNYKILVSTQLAQMLSQQKQTLQASLHSSQQAFSQLQQQVQMMQPSSQASTMQQNVATES